MQQQHHYQQLIDLFDSCFAEEFNTRLIKGDDEPIYLPADDETPYHRIVFAHGFFASALHEISHWCVAGKARREQVDFGYWYCVAAGFPFNVSCDNLEGDVEPDRIAFQRRVHVRVMTLLEQGIPERPARFIRALQHYYQTPPLTAKHFPWPEDLH